MTTQPVSSLRERSKAKRRAGIQREALRLFAEHGYDGATIAEIADAAEVAPRTVSLYFPTKLDIALSVAEDLAGRLAATFAAHPGMQFSAVIDLWLASEAETLDSELAALMVTVYQANPGLSALSGARLTEVSAIAETALLAQMGLPATDPIVPVVAAAVTAALSTFYRDIARAKATRHSRESFITYLNAIISSARTPSR